MKATFTRLFFAWRAACGRDATRARSLARRQAAVSIPWPDKTVFLVNPNPLVRDRAGVAILAAFAGVMLMLGLSQSPLPRYLSDRAVRPSMEAAMRAGNAGAATWLGARFEEDYPGLLASQADAGEATAMYLVGRALMRDPTASRAYPRSVGMTRGQRETIGWDFVRRAAAAGNEAALLLLIDRGQSLQADASVSPPGAGVPTPAGKN
ncbi:hypothetical protein EFP18_28820 (plasmid) [Burkholderia glumae]|uniref:hypothetical protein n=1 Tax=Burkholderia glumae TaxID=337 RepID=UPI0020CC8E9A|nr:hypothetical protein [Burkholderia glumae]MCQ0034626.1 hypothetical protein [Burkholderia glumae]MCQ0040277.1 hypothetical protein [Burkholderia glumae]UVS88126.1 hypothetical protein EFP18_28820 [Burkholderia glumae]